MEKDIASEIYDRITRDVNKGLNGNDKIRDLLKKIKSGKATYRDTDELAYEYGKVYSEALSKNLTSGTLPDGKMYYNIAERTIRPALTECYGNVASAAAETQRIVNKNSGINIAPQKAPLNSDRIAGIIDRATEAEQFDDVSWILKDPVVNFSQSVVDDTVKVNAEFHSKAGLTPKIVRRAEHKCCKWCSNLEGTYNYPDDTPDDIFRRHENCRCTVEMHSEKGIQNAHTKKWRDPKESEIIEQRKQIGKSLRKIENSPKSGDNLSVRKWYIAETAKIADQIDPTLPKEKQARIAFEKRNEIRKTAQGFMTDTKALKEIKEKHETFSFDELIEHKMKEKNMTRDEALDDIIKTATKTNENVNKALGIGDKK